MEKKFDTICAHAGAEADALTGAITAPLYFSTTFQYTPTGDAPTGNIYSREGNPTRHLLEKVLADMEFGLAAAAFSSGSAAAQAAFMSMTPGDHIIVNNRIYSGVRNMLTDIFIPWGLEVSFVDLTQIQNLENNIQPNTRMVWTESPTNPEMTIVDIKAVVSICKPRKIMVAIDNTFATPLLQHPLTLGADLVMHSTTKYLGGHSDLTGGALITAEVNDWWKKIIHIQKVLGAVPAPFDCWLLLRGIRSFVPRMQLHVNNAKKVAAYLQTNNMVEKVLYPGLSTHSGHAVAAAQMEDFGAMVSFLVKNGKQAAIAVIKKLRVFTNATSLGGTESLAEHRQSAEGPNSTTPENLIRLSIGLENADDLIEDLKQALE